MPELDVVRKPTELEEKALSIPDQVREITITSPETYQQMADMFLVIRGLRKEIKETFDPLIQKAHEAHKAILAEKARHDKPLDEGERTAKSLMQAYDAEQARIAVVEEARLREINRKTEEQRLLNEALAAEAEGDKEILREIEDEMSKPVYVPPIHIPKAVPKVSGVVFKTYWKWKVVNEKLIPREYLKIDDVKLNGVVTAMKDSAKIPGIEIYLVRI
jgi:hypothetical protein